MEASLMGTRMGAIYTKSPSQYGWNERKLWTYREIGQRLNERVHLDKAEAKFARIGVGKSVTWRGRSVPWVHISSEFID